MVNVCDNLIEKKCPYCDEIISGKHSLFANHIRWCKHNPNHEHIISNSVKSGRLIRTNKYGEFKDFEVICYVCHKKFIVHEREKLFPSKQRYYCSRSCANTRKHNNETKKKISESIKKTIQHNIANGMIQNIGHCTGGNISFKFNDGKHQTWDNEIVYLRSSYELDYACKLDQSNIKYEVERLRIPYFDSKLNKYRYSVPDFYLPIRNTIVEVKSEFTYDRENMISKVKKYMELGYKVILILDHKEYNICNINDLPEQKMNRTIYNI